MVKRQNNDITGVWRVTVQEAPFKFHMFTFHADGTMLQSNPPAGNTQTSDTSGMGLWRQDGDDVRAKFEEFRVDYETGHVTRGVVNFWLKVQGNTFAGTCTFTICNPETNDSVGTAQASALQAVRVTLD